MESSQRRLTDVVQQWVHGWALARGLAVVESDAGVLLARPDDTYRREELFVAGPSTADLAQFEQQHRGDDRIWLTAFVPPDTIPEGLRLVNATETRMVGDLVESGRARRAGLELEFAGPVATVRFIADGEQAASGTVSVAGEPAVFDRIKTHEAFQRQGYGRAVMDELTAAARTLGARRGTLVASPEGRALYTHLGWSALAPLATYAPASSAGARPSGDVAAPTG